MSQAGASLQRTTSPMAPWMAAATFFATSQPAFVAAAMGFTLSGAAYVEDEPCAGGKTAVLCPLLPRQAKPMPPVEPGADARGNAAEEAGGGDPCP